MFTASGIINTNNANEVETYLKQNKQLRLLWRSFAFEYKPYINTGSKFTEKKRIFEHIKLGFKRNLL